MLKIIGSGAILLLNLGNAAGIFRVNTRVAQLSADLEMLELSA
jgi:hypothetical protein